MKKPSSTGGVALAALIGAIALLGFSTPAQAYPEAQVGISVDRSQLYVGESFSATGTSQSASCSWTMTWNGEERRGSSSAGHDFVTSFRAPNVKHVTQIPLRGTCAFDAQSGRGTAAAERTVTVTVLPRSTEVSPPVGAGSDLPNTGGPNALFLLGGVALLLVGATAVTVARRRAEEAETQAFRA
jgi:LPXTG-motif cell wall-anchored protein